VGYDGSENRSFSIWQFSFSFSLGFMRSKSSAHFMSASALSGLYVAKFRTFSKNNSMPIRFVLLRRRSSCLHFSFLCSDSDRRMYGSISSHTRSINSFQSSYLYITWLNRLDPTYSSRISSSST